MRALRGAWGMPVVLAAAAGPGLVSRADVPPPDYDFQWANISDRNNAAYPGPGGNAGRGSVSYAYRMSKLEITSKQWADFLGMVQRQGVDPSAHDLTPIFWGGTQNPMRPVMGLGWRAGAYYCNWLNNGKQESWASCLDGAYMTATFGGAVGSPYTEQLYHSPNAKFWIPTLDEYLKAAHYDPKKGGAGQGGWWAYPYQSDVPPVPGAPGVGQTTGGWEPGGFGELAVNLGAYSGSVSAYGLWDLSGGAKEWVEEPATFDAASGHYKRRREFGSYAGDRGYLDSDHVQGVDGDYPGIIGGFSGFRIAGQVPSPSGAAVMLAALGACAGRRRRGA